VGRAVRRAHASGVGYFGVLFFGPALATPNPNVVVFAQHLVHGGWGACCGWVGPVRLVVLLFVVLVVCCVRHMWVSGVCFMHRRDCVGLESDVIKSYGSVEVLVEGCACWLLL